MQSVQPRRYRLCRAALADTPLHQYRSEQYADAGGPCIGHRQHTRRGNGGVQPGHFPTRPETRAGPARQEKEPAREHPEPQQPDGRRGHQAGAGSHRPRKQATRLYPLQPGRGNRCRYRLAKMHEPSGERFRAYGYSYQQARLQPVGAVRRLVSGQLLFIERGIRPIPDPLRCRHVPDVQGAHTAQRRHAAKNILHRPPRGARSDRHHRKRGKGETDRQFQFFRTWPFRQRKKFRCQYISPATAPTGNGRSDGRYG